MSEEKDKKDPKESRPLEVEDSGEHRLDEDGEGARFFPAEGGDTLMQHEGSSGLEKPPAPQPLTPSKSVVAHYMQTLGVEPRSVEETDPLEEVAGPGGGGRYRAGKEMARGGMGAIVEIYDRDIRRPVAMKVLLRSQDRDAIERFIEEAQVTGQLEHPNIVPVHELGIDGEGKIYFTMKLVQGDSLQHIIDRLAQARGRGDGKDTPRSRLLQIFLKACDAVAFAHSRGIIHRDLKPENIMVGRFGEVLVMDWGLAKLKGSEDTVRDAVLDTISSSRETGRTLDGAVLGTPSFMPPEQADGRIDEVDEQSDIWALGAILYALLCFEAPHTGSTVHNVLASAAKGDVKPPTRRAPHLTIPRELEAVCMRCLASAKADRYPSVDSLVADIQAYLDSRLVSAYRYSLRERFFRFVQRHPSASVGTGVALLLLVLGSTLATFIIQQAHIDRLRAQEAERLKKEAEVKAETATSLLEKGRRVSSLLQSARIDLASVFRTLESRRHARQAGKEKKKHVKRRQEKIKAFEERVPKDSASRAAWQALKGWLGHLAGDEEGAQALFSESTKTDPDVVYGRLFEAMAAAVRFLSAQRMPKLDQSGGSFRIREKTVETEEIQVLRERFEASLDAVSSSSVWGAMSGEEFAAVLDGLRGLRGGKLEKAEAALTRTLAIPEMSWLETDLLLARAKIREMLGRLKDMEDDLLLIRERFPDHNRARYFLGRCRLGQARVIMGRRKDSRPRYLQALALFDEAVKIDPEDHPARGHRALVNLLMARIHAHRAMKYTENFVQAVEDFTVLRKVYAEDLDHLSNRAWAYRDWGTILVSHNEDGIPLLKKALEDYTELIGLLPDSPRWYALRASVYVRLSWAEHKRGGDPGAAFAQGRADAENSLARSKNKIMALGLLAQLLVAEAEWRASKGEDVRGNYAKAVEHYSAMLAQKPNSPFLLLDRGTAYRALADAKMRHNVDGRKDLDLSVKDLRAAVAKDPRSSHCRSQLAESLISISALDAKAGKDSTALVQEALKLLGQCIGFSRGIWNYRLRRMGLVIDHLDLLAKTAEEKRSLLETGIKDCGLMRRKVPRLVEALSRRAALLLLLARTWEDLGGDEARSHLEKALADCDEYIKGRPKAVTIRLTRTEVLLLLGRTDEARAQLKEAKPLAKDKHAEAVKELERMLQDAEKK